jgi:hypothetical protein
MSEETNIKRIKSGDATRKRQKTGIYQEGVAVKGGKRGGSKKTKAKDESHKGKMSPIVQKTLYETGSIWFHRSTGITVTFLPREALTLTFLRDKLVASLPADNLSVKQLTKSGKIVNITSNLAKVIKGQRPAAFDWTCKRLN